MLFRYTHCTYMFVMVQRKQTSYASYVECLHSGERIVECKYIYILQILHRAYEFIFTVYVYKSTLPHLDRCQKNKLYGKVKRKNGQTIEPEIPSIPNGWFYLLSSSDLAKEQVKHVTLCGKLPVLYTCIHM